jgi:hypothetical protein
MRRHEFLGHLHRLVRPRNYLEIGVEAGSSLTLSRVPTIGIDPAFRVITPLQCDLQLVRATSDDFFARADPIRHLRSGRNPIRNARRGRPLLGHYLGGTTIDLAFIDGMHQSDYVLRDFMNIERLAAWSSVIVFDDMLPRDVDEAARDRHTEQWAGDVYKLIEVLARHRPDLAVIPVDTAPTGTLVVLGADARSRVLADRYDAILKDIVVPDPQDVPRWVLERQSAVSPDALVASPLWADLVRARGRRRGREAGMQMIDRHLGSMGVTRTGRPVAADS